MGNEVASLVAREQAINQYIYESIETTATIAITIEHMTTHYFNSVALVSITLDFDGDGKATPSRFTTEVYTTTIYLMDSLRPLVRKTDVVFLLNSSLHFKRQRTAGLAIRNLGKESPY